jgi:hypothetical protein
MQESNGEISNDDDAPALSPVVIKRGGSGEGSLCSIKIKREARRVGNERGETRRSAYDREATVSLRGESHPAKIINRSDSGAMIESPIQPIIGEPMEVDFGDGNPEPCVARWLREGRIGIEFGNHDLLVGRSLRDEFVFGMGKAAPQPEAEEADDPAAEREPRQAVIRTAKLRSGNKVLQVRLCNISPHGAMLESDQCLTPGSQVRLEMGGGVLVTAKVRWNNGRKAGLRFDDLLDPASLSPFSVTHRPGMIKPSYLDSEFDPNSPWAARFEKLTLDNLNSSGEEESR